MTKLILFLKKIGVEVVVVFFYILLINNYLGNVDTTINADGEGYYDYLPSAFIHNDLQRNNATIEQDTALYDRISKYGFYVDYHGYKVNKYPCGTAVLESPFFFFAYLTTPLEYNDNDGYQSPFQKAVFYSTLFYLFLALFFFGRSLRLFNINRVVIILLQILLVFE